jgi:hypothetical protein
MDDQDPEVQFYVPAEQEEGAYAHTFAIWSTAYEFNLDFAVRGNADYAERDTPIAGRFVALVRIPPPLAFELIRSINAEMESYEKRWGTIHRPGSSEETEP